MSRQAALLPYYHSFIVDGQRAARCVAARLVDMAPGPMAHVFFGNSGSDANDTQIKLIWYYNNALGRPQKKKIISRRRAYHGVTVTERGLSGLDHVHAGSTCRCRWSATPPRRTGCGRPSLG